MKETIKLTTLHRNVVCPKCQKADKLEYNRIFKHVGETIGAGSGATFGWFGIKAGSAVSAAALTIIGTATGTIVGGLSGVIVGYVAGRDIGEKIGRDIESALKQRFRCHRCKITFKR